MQMVHDLVISHQRNR